MKEEAGEKQVDRNRAEGWNEGWRARDGAGVTLWDLPALASLPGTCVEQEGACWESPAKAPGGATCLVSLFLLSDKRLALNDLLKQSECYKCLHPPPSPWGNVLYL